MKKIDYPQKEEKEYFNLISGNRRGQAKIILENNKNLIFGAYRDYLSKGDRLHQISPLQITEELRGALHLCYENNIDLRKETQRTNSGILKSCCPFCMRDSISCVDHYFPKSHYPEFSIFSPNLLPICWSCNHKKGDKCIENGSRSFIHFYFDKFLGKTFLKCKIDFDRLEIQFSLDNGDINASNFKIIENHFEKLSLFSSYVVACSTDLAYIIKEKNNNVEILKIYVVEEIKRLKDYGPNYYKLVFWKVILDKLTSS